MTSLSLLAGRSVGLSQLQRHNFSFVDAQSYLDKILLFFICDLFSFMSPVTNRIHAHFLFWPLRGALSGHYDEPLATWLLFSTLSKLRSALTRAI